MSTQPHIEPAQGGPITDTLLDAMINVSHKARKGECTKNEAETMLYLAPELFEELAASRKAIAGMIWSNTRGHLYEPDLEPEDNVIHIHPRPEAAE